MSEFSNSIHQLGERKTLYNTYDMFLGPNYYRLNGYEIISGLIDLVDLDGNIKFDENHLLDMMYYQDKECAISAKKITEIMLACHLKHQEGEDCLM